VVADAHRLYLADGGKCVGFTFGFDKSNPIFPDRIKAISKDLAAVALAHDDESSGEIDSYVFRDAMPELISIYRGEKEYASPKWRIAQVHRFGRMSKDDLEAIVREKDSKASQYEACDAYWLLVVVDGFDAAQEQEIRVDGLCVSSSKFEKIIVFHTFGHFVEIATAPRWVST